MVSVAVTGGSGFIGRRLIPRLCRDGVAVRALMRRRPLDGAEQTAAEKDQLTIIRGALRDDRAMADLIEGVDAVIHLAGLIKARTRQDFFDANAEGTRHLADVMVRSGAQPKLVMVSSLAAREPHLSSYAASKRAGEAALADQAGALPWSVLRPPAVYGPGDRETLAFFKGIHRGIGAMLSGKRARFSLLHVDDLIEAVLAVLQPGIADGRILELDDGQAGGHSWASMIDAAERIFDRKVLRIPVPKPVLSALGGINAGLRILPGYTPMLTQEKVRELTHQNWIADCRSILSSTSWRPAIPVDRGFRATVEWYRLHNWL